MVIYREISGTIEDYREIGITCCDYNSDINISGQSLYYFLSEFLDPDCTFSLRYIILDKKPSEEVHFDNLAATVVTNMLYSSEYR